MGLEIIRTIMQKQGMTSDKLSSLSGVPKSTIDKIASGATDNPRYRSLQKLVDVLGLGMDDFIRLVDNRQGNNEDDTLLYTFHALNEEGRRCALQILRDMADSGHYTPVPSAEKAE